LLNGLLHRATQLGTGAECAQMPHYGRHMLGLRVGIERNQPGNGRTMAGDGDFFTMLYRSKQFRKPVFGFKDSDSFHAGLLSVSLGTKIHQAIEIKK
jgi:hypothetical protein